MKEDIKQLPQNQVSSVYDRPFGNPVSKHALKNAQKAFKMCSKMFKLDDALDLVAIPKGEVYRDFKVMTLVRRNDTEAMIDSETGKTLKYEEVNPKKAIVIGTIRMGFGHWRIAIALASAAHKMGIKPYLLDLMSFNGTSIKKSIKLLEGLYNKFSQLSQKSQFFNKYIWEKITSETNATLDSSIQNRELSRMFIPAFEKLPKNIPMVAAHPWVGNAAVLAGMDRVISMIPDNLPLAFWLVEGSIHTVQSPSAFMGYRTLLNMEKGGKIVHCLPKEDIIETGHYVDYELASTIKKDCANRLKRAKEKKPRRFLLTMGGAGAQALKFADIALYCKDYIAKKKAALLINMGDHEGRWQILKEHLDNNDIHYTMHTSWKTSRAWIEKADSENVTGVHVFLHKDFYAAVYTTNLLMRISDIMITKPSELSFYPIPKLFIQRVGRHEAWGAIRGSEIGDGTKEADKTGILHRLLTTLIEEDDLLETFIKHIEINDKAGIYLGAYNVVKIATKTRPNK